MKRSWRHDQINANHSIRLAFAHHRGEFQLTDLGQATYFAPSGWPARQQMIDNLEEVLAALPLHLSDAIRVELATGQRGALIEIVMDLGRKPEARFQSSELYLAEA